MVQLPERFVNRIREQIPDASALLSSLNQPSPVSIRLNPLKPDSVFDSEDRIAWCPMGRYLQKRPVFTLDPLFHAGVYYPQEAGSMFVDEILRTIELPDSPVCLDLCAAPGGKSTVLLSHLSGKGLLVANEIIKNRALVLRENLIKWGAGNCIVTNNEAADFSQLGSVFDFVLLDAPCSGEGMFRKDEQSRGEWSEENAEHCVVRQREILEDIWPSVRSGGYVLYSTCTYNKEENEEQIREWIEEGRAELVQLQFPDEWNLTTGTGELGWYCYPHKMKTEGFYFVLLKKTESPEVGLSGKKTGKKKMREEKRDHPELIKGIVHSEYSIHYYREQFYAFPTVVLETGKLILDKLRCLKWGVRLGGGEGKKFIPDHEWGMAVHVPADFPKINLDEKTALRYLKGEAIQIDGPKGWVLVSFKEKVLGFGKNLGNRMNNYYPKEYRIRMKIE